MAPESYWALSNEERYELVNGCGPYKASGLIPSSLFGADLSPACDIHDFTYSKTKTVTNRSEADNLFLVNMCDIANREIKGPIKRIFAELGIAVYYFMVRIFGRKYFGG